MVIGLEVLTSKIERYRRLERTGVPFVLAKDAARCVRSGSLNPHIPPRIELDVGGQANVNTLSECLGSREDRASTPNGATLRIGEMARGIVENGRSQ